MCQVLCLTSDNFGTGSFILLGDLEAALKMAMNQKELEVPWSDQRPVPTKALGRGVAKKLSSKTLEKRRWGF